MKVIPANLQAHYDSGETSLAHGLVIERADGQVFAYTSHDQPLTLNAAAWGLSSALVFDAAQGLTASEIVSTAGFAVDNLELTTLDDGTLFVRDEVLAGAWRNAAFRLFRYRWDVSPVTIADHVEVLMRGWLGEIEIRENTVRVELRGLAQKLQQPVGEVSTKTCRNRLGDARCGVNLTPLTFNLTVTAVTDRRTFTAAAATQAADYFGDGIVTWTSGNNVVGAPCKVRSFAGGVFTLQLPTTRNIQVGDTFTAIAGCRKRLMEDCKAKFGNVLNFRGEPHRPTLDSLLVVK